MKNWTWKQWTAFGIVVAIIITEVVVVFTAPWTALFGIIMAVAGFVAGRISNKYIDINKPKTENKE